MTNPYIPPTLTGYNSLPPPNDGSETVDNQLDWQKHIDKIGDPLKNYINALSTAVTAAFNASFGAAAKSISSNYTVVEADQGKFLLVSGSTTITLASATTVGSGFPLIILNSGSNFVTVNAAGSETVLGSTSQTMSPNMGLIITSNGANWLGLITPPQTSPVINGFFETENWNNDAVFRSLDFYGRRGVGPSSFDGVGTGLRNGAEIQATGRYVFRIENIVQNPDSATPGFRFRLNVADGLTGFCDFRVTRHNLTSGAFEGSAIENNNLENQPSVTLAIESVNPSLIVVQGTFEALTTGKLIFEGRQSTAHASVTTWESGGSLYIGSASN